MEYEWKCEIILSRTCSSDNDLPPGRHQAIIWTNAGILLIRTLGTNLSEILTEIHTFSFKKMHLKMSCGKWRPLCLGLNMLMRHQYVDVMIYSLQYNSKPKLGPTKPVVYRLTWLNKLKLSGDFPNECVLELEQHTPQRGITQLIFLWINWPPFNRRHFYAHFLEWKSSIFD